MHSQELYHHGTKGQKWGVRRYQNSDGSLTPQGKLRYGRTEASSDVMKVAGNKKAAKDAFKTENKLQKKYKKALKSNDPNKINDAKQSINKFKSDKNKLYKSLGMNKEEMKFRDAQASYAHRTNKAAVKGGIAGAVVTGGLLATGIMTMSPALVSAGMIAASAAIAGTGGAAGAITGIIGSSATTKGQSYIEAYRNTYNDFKKTQGHNTRTIV